MNPQHIEQCRDKLLTMKAELQALTRSSQQSGNTEAVMLDQQSVGRLSRMDAMQAQQMALEQERRRQQQWRAVLSALQRIEQEDFGYCQPYGLRLKSRHSAFLATYLDG